MLRADALVGRPVIAADTGEKLGEVADTLIIAGSGAIAGFIVRGGWHAPERVLRRSDVMTLGRDALIAAPAAHLIDAAEWRDLGVGAERLASFRNKPVVTRAGEKIGEVVTVLLDEKTPEICGYDVTTPGFAGLVDRHTTLPHSSDVILGPDVIVVPERLPDPAASDAEVPPETA